MKTLKDDFLSWVATVGLQDTPPEIQDMMYRAYNCGYVLARINLTMYLLDNERKEELDMLRKLFQETEFEYEVAL